MTLPETRTLFFEDLALGMRESHAKLVKSSPSSAATAIRSICPSTSPRKPRSAGASPTGFTPRA